MGCGTQGRRNTDKLLITSGVGGPDLERAPKWARDHCLDLPVRQEQGSFFFGAKRERQHHLPVCLYYWTTGMGFFCLYG
jgi:hypothetical protein